MEDLVRSAVAAIHAAQNAEDLEAIRVRVMGRKGELAELSKDMGKLTPAERAERGKFINQSKQALEAAYEGRKAGFERAALAKRLDSEWLDLTLPAPGVRPGSLHPITQIQWEIEDLFRTLGFSVLDGPEVETEFHNFDALNIPGDHPARDMQDTFWLDGGHLLRTHTSPVQVRGMEKLGPPLRMIAPGRVFRNESVDASHEHTFYQLEGMMIDRNVSVGNLIYFMKTLLTAIFKRDVTVRLRPGFFPFVEPGFELDIRCLICGGDGCPVCKQSGWVELLPCGLVNPHVLRMSGIDPAEWNGFAFGLGLTRLVMMRYAIDDIRWLPERRPAIPEAVLKFSYSWIRGFVDGLDVPAEALERLITMKTAECEGVETVGALLADAVPAMVESVEPVEGSHNVKAVVDADRYGKKTIVCGAPNCRAGLRTVYVPLGVKTVSGIESDGMLASASELGINRDHAGILELRGGEIPPPDSVIEIDNKSITHRPDLWGHHGMAREVAAITGKKLRDPVSLENLPAPGGPVKIEIEDLALCPRFTAIVFENVRVQPSPLWLQARLTAVGLNPINNIVDLTNYIMAELAQPTHAYDRAKLHGDTIWARPAREGERIVALNHEEYTLTPANLVIADAAGPVGIAGVIGGLASAISDTTTSIVFEAANFHAGSVRKTSAALKLRTDASMRFEKAQDPHNTVRALARAIDMMPIVSPGAKLVGGLAECSAPLCKPEAIALDLAWLACKLGRELEPTEVRRILESLEFSVKENGPGAFLVTVPSWRATKDVAMAEDLVEEVGRMIGYDSIAPAPPLVPCAPSYDPPEREFLRSARRMMAAQGYTEVSNYSFISEEDARSFGWAVEDHVRVLNPIAAGQELMRTSLLPGIHRNIVENAKHFDEFRLFEIGHEIHKTNGKPEERQHLMAALFSKNDGLLELKRAAECLAPGLHVRPAEPRVWEHPARCAELWWNGREFGRLGELHPSLVENGHAAVLDIDLALLAELTSARASYTPVRRFPTSAFDLSVIAGVRELVGELEAAIRRIAGELAVSVEYVRQYQGEKVPDGKKSVSFRVVAGAADRTLSSEEITALRDRIITGLQGMGYELRV